MQKKKDDTIHYLPHLYFVLATLCKSLDKCINELKQGQYSSLSVFSSSDVPWTENIPGLATVRQPTAGLQVSLTFENSNVWT